METWWIYDKRPLRQGKTLRDLLPFIKPGGQLWGAFGVNVITLFATWWIYDPLTWITTPI